MFEKEKKTLESNQFIIVYDKLTKPLAKYLFNELSGIYSCVLWSKNDYLGNEAKIKNTNKILFFDEQLIKENLSVEYRKVELNKSVIIAIQGPVAGMYINPSIDLTTEVFKDNWGKMIIGMIACGLIGASLLYWYLSFNKKKINRFKILLDAVKEFKDSLVLKEFMNGTEH